jgi:hypothetical protein
VISLREDQLELGFGRTNITGASMRFRCFIVTAKQIALLLKW